MLRHNLRPAAFDDDHGPADSSAIARDEHGPVVMVDVHADEFAEPSCPSQSSEVADEARRIPRQADDSAVDIDDEGVRAIDLCPGR